MSIHLIGRDNGAGLSRDLAVLAGVLGDAGFAVQVSRLGSGGWSQFTARQRLRLAGGGRRIDLNLLLERTFAAWQPLARRNVLVPNPEWFRERDRRGLAGIDRLFAKTRHAAEIFAGEGCRTQEIGFSSADRLDAKVPRRDAFLHLAGQSPTKGTAAVLEAWAAHPGWPPLTVVHRRARLPGPAGPNVQVVTGHMDDHALRTLQNSHRFHLCPSTTEGFGHHLVEGLGVGALVLTTAAPPMDELVTPARGLLLPWARRGRMALARTHEVTAAAIGDGVERALALAPAQRHELGQAARHWFLANRAAFRRRLVAAVEAEIGARAA